MKKREHNREKERERKKVFSLGVRDGRVERNTFCHRCREWASIFHDKLALRCVSTIRSENNKYFRRAGEEKRGRKIETRYICIYKIEYGRQRERSRG